MRTKERIEPFIEIAGRSKASIDTPDDDGMSIKEAQEGNWWSCIRCTAVNSGGASMCDKCSSPNLVKPELHVIAGKPAATLPAAGKPPATVTPERAEPEASPVVPPAGPARVKERVMFEALDGSLYGSREEALQHNGLAAVERLLQEHFGKGDQAAEWMVKNFHRLHGAYVENSRP